MNLRDDAELARLERIIELLARSVGTAAATTALGAAAKAYGIDLERMSFDEEQIVLQRIAESPGLIGITAQLAGARLRLEAVQQRMRRPARNDD
jgi:hypothetical protein